MINTVIKMHWKITILLCVINKSDISEKKYKHWLLCDEILQYMNIFVESIYHLCLEIYIKKDISYLC